MGFSGSGSNVTRAHTHDSTVIQDGGSLAANVTQFGLSSGSILYSDGSNIQELGVGAGGKVLAVSGSSLPEWVTPTDTSPLLKVTKSYSDIVVGTTSMAIYTLPQSAALVNVWADITTVFDISTAVTIGDAGDDNGFQDATNWTSSTGLTDATRGDYIQNFKTMRSISGTTAISAYNFTTIGASTFSQLLGGATRSLSSNPGREELAQKFTTGHVLEGEVISNASWWIGLDQGSPTGNVQAFIRQSDGTIRETSSTTVDASSVSTEIEYTFNFAGTTTLATDDMITITLDNGTGGASNSLFCRTNGTTMTDGILYGTSTAGSSYSELTNTQMKMTVGYGALVSDTQGDVDFYLQVVD